MFEPLGSRIELRKTTGGSSDCTSTIVGTHRIRQEETAFSNRSPYMVSIGGNWSATRLMITLRDGKHVAPRWSAVFPKEDGVWTIVQTSIAEPNDEVGWVYGG